MKRTLYLLFAVLSAAILVNLALATEATWTITEERLGTLQEWRYLKVALSTDKCSWAYVESRGDKERVVVDGQPQQEFDSVKYLLFSPDGKRVAFLALKGEKMLVVVDGKIVSKHDGYCPRFEFDSKSGYLSRGDWSPAFGLDFERPPTDLQFSPDSKHVVYRARKENKAIVVMDGKPGPTYDEIMSYTPKFSKNGKSWAYVGSKGEKMIPVINGVAGHEYALIERIVLAPKGNRVAFVATHGDGKWFVVADGKPHEPYDAIDDIFFGPDGEHLAYRANKGGKWFMVVDGKAESAYQALGRPVFSPNGQRLAYIAGRGTDLVPERNILGDPIWWRARNGEVFVVLDGKPQTPYQGIYSFWGGVVYSLDSKRIAYKVKIGDKWSVVVDNKYGKLYKWISDIIFSPDGRRLAYKAQKGDKWVVVIDGQPGPEYEAINSIVFSTDGRRVAYAAEQNGKQFVVVDNKRGTSYNYVSLELVFSPGGKHLAYVAGDNKQYLVVVDGQPGPEYDAIEGDILFTQKGVLRYVARRNNSLYLVQHVPAERRY